jgi:hypothetical protein
LDISPDTQIDFDMLVGDVQLTVYDAISIENDPVDEPSLSNSANFSRLNNTAGVDALWEANEYLELGLGYYYSMLQSLNEEFQALDSNIQGLKGHIGWKAMPSTTIGIRGNARMIQYSETVLNDGFLWDAGPYIETQPSEYISLGASAAFSGGTFGSTGTIGDNASDLSTYIAEGHINHHVNEYLTHSIEGGRNIRIGTTSNFYELYFLRHSAQWDVLTDVTLNTNVFVDKGTTSGGLYEEEFDRWGAGAALGYQITERLQAALGYNYLQKISNIPDRNYGQNRIFLDLRYDF